MTRTTSWECSPWTQLCASQAKRDSTSSRWRRKQNVIKLKEMKLRPKVAEHDFQTKFKGLKQFLEAGEKVKVTIMFRGREMVHQDIGRRILDRVADDAKPFAVVERAPLLEGKNLFMILAPSRQGAVKETATSA